MRRKTDFATGLETILNNPQTSFLKNPKVFNEIHQQSQMPLSQMIRTIGKTSKNQKRQPQEPTDDEKSKARLDQMENKQKE